MKKVVLFIINVYRKHISPIYPSCCRFYPTCSTYAYNAVEEYGAIKGVFLAIKRLLKCHPLHKGGYDPLPLNKKKV